MPKSNKFLTIQKAPLGYWRMSDDVPVAGPQHLFWRVRCVGVSGVGINISIAEIEMRATLAGADQCSGGDAFATSTDSLSSPDNAFDDSGSTDWQTEDDQIVDESIEYHFATGVNVAQVAITASATTYATESPDTIIIEWSDDGIVWVPVHTSTGLTWTISEVKLFTTEGLIFDEMLRTNGTINGTPTLGVAGHVDGSTAITFDPANTDYISFPASSLLDYNPSTTAFSIALWFRCDDIAVNTVMASRMQGTTGYDKGWRIWFVAAGVPRFQIATSNSASFALDVYPSTGTFDDGNWHHLCYTYDGSQQAANMTLYIDGVDRATAAGGVASIGTGANPTNTTFEIGGRNGGNEPFEGDLQEVALFGYELTAQQAREQYYAGMGHIGYPLEVLSLQDPYLYHRFGEDVTGTSTLVDESTREGPYDYTLAGTAAFNNGSSLLSGDDNASIAFDGVDQRASGNDAMGSFATDGPMTVSMWFATSISGHEALWCAYDTGGWGNVMSIALNELTAGEITLARQATAGVAHGGGLAIFNSLNDGQPHHLVVLMDEPNQKQTIYIDGIKAAAVTTIYTGLVWSLCDSSYYACKNEAGTGLLNYFNGVLDEPFMGKENQGDWAYQRMYVAGKRSDKGGYAFHALYVAPMCYWRLGEDGGTVAADTIGRWDGTYTGSPTLNVDALLVRDNNKSVTFSGTGQYITMGDVGGLEYYHAFSISMLIKTTATGNQVLIGKQSLGGSAQGWQLEMTSGLLKFSIYNAGATTGIDITSTDTAINDGAIHHVVVTYDGSNLVAGMNMYVDHVVQTFSTGTDTLGANTIITTANLVIGASTSGTLAFNGTLDEVIMVQRELTQLEVDRLYWPSLGWFGVSLIELLLEPIHVWALNDAGPTTCEDCVGTLDAAAVNTPAFEQPSLVRSRPDTYSIRLRRSGSQHITVDTSAVLDGAAFSIMALVQITQTGVQHPIWTERAGSTNVLTLKIDTDETVEFNVYETFVNHTVTSAQSLVPGQVYMIVATLHASTGMKLYINGVEDGTDANVNVPVDTVDNVYIGFDGALSRFDGWIDGIAVYDKALTATEILDAYAETLDAEDAVPFAPNEILQETFLGAETLLIQLGAVAEEELFVADAPGQWEIMVEAIAIADTLLSERFVTVERIDTLLGADTIVDIVGKRVVETLLTNGNLLSQITGFSSTLDSMSFSEQVGIAFQLFAVEGVIFGDAVADTPRKGVIITELLLMSGLVTNELRAAAVAAEVLILQDLISSGKAGEVTETLVVADAILKLYNAIVAQLDTTLFDDESVLIPRFNMVISDAVIGSDSNSVNWAIIEALSDGIVFGGSIALPDGVFTAMVLNTESLGVTEYTNYPFNSFGKMGQTYLGATDSAIYALNGASDDGTNIDAVIRSGMTNFGTNLYKRVPRAYLGYTSDGALIMKTLSTSGGVKTERWYELTPRTADAPTGARIKLGRGVKATYWQFELVNKSGADFDISSLQLFPMILNRRV